MTYQLRDFDYELPQSLIAQRPTPIRSQSRLLVVNRKISRVDQTNFRDSVFSEIASILTNKDLLVFNNSKVIPARVIAQKPTGGAVEILVERILAPDRASVMLRANRKPAAGSILIAHGHRLEVIGRDPDHQDRFQIRTNTPILALLDHIGQLPLPPYIAHPAESSDEDRYQTVYADRPGSVAAPTAGLHFDQPLLAALAERGVGMAWVTLHVGSGTFAPVREDDLSKHRMHSEWCELPRATADAIEKTKSQGGRVVAVGTTSLRTLESAALRLPVNGNTNQGQDNTGSAGLAGAWETDLFITPGFEFRLVDAMVTNFHLPRSTLLMLVSAFAGYETIQRAYAHAIAERYRFFSYGDAMFLERC